MDRLAIAWGVPAVLAYAQVSSTMDLAHEMAQGGAPSGTLVLAERQDAGRGRNGHPWHSAPGTTLTFSLIERPRDAAAIRVLSLRLGLRATMALRRHAPDLQVKWPNDIVRAEGKVGGILVEARWRGDAPDWVVIGVGLNVVESPWAGGSALATQSSRSEILAELLPTLRAAATATGELSDAELSQWRALDWARGRLIASPIRGVVRGIAPDGSLMVDTPAGVTRCTSGSLRLAED